MKNVLKSVYMHCVKLFMWSGMVSFLCVRLWWASPQAFLKSNHVLIMFVICMFKRSRQFRDETYFDLLFYVIVLYKKFIDSFGREEVKFLTGTDRHLKCSFNKRLTLKIQHQFSDISRVTHAVGVLDSIIVTECKVNSAYVRVDLQIWIQ